ncbi:hypothetical protein O6H91_19G064100 [Diphasiastrum complanatum]|uniref:Uncharacterized protein n=1 Tax=Diphasiastrum complanatum TaxID=34168 RepID=A0ACC2AXA3_DIPCM|nr:hypothetical protein O6H91_19G064100 [Diphasiastrum complanatum]
MTTTEENFSTGINLPTFQPSVTLTLKLNITVENPNRAGFAYNNGTSYLFYHGDEVGQALVPAGRISAQGKETMVTLVHIQADRFLANSNFTSDIKLGLLPVSSQTALSGRVRILKIITRHVTATTVCDLVVSVSSRNIQSFHCSYKVKL